ncbi:hypothetical protein Sden_3278 [Shewanella denitrificans OS217]|jgi:hypothetical protein|uniref:Uncharacterized protein n=1 Tax=Shewanella denitrificans (strain OS217 / ATCC BAA-1090 / DSM 15013) TaxID=318161 RepID=Q12J22_SHEDO|nr:hypothetical protein [Shewanella denitrificans]ABE56554.1 hypothetical protein Sden_3278 [Shewanella denitrificans OS217]
MNTFSTRNGVVTLSMPFTTIMYDYPQIELTYKPNNYSGWGVCKIFNALECEPFEQADAELFAETAESKLRIRQQPLCNNQRQA